MLTMPSGLTTRRASPFEPGIDDDTHPTPCPWITPSLDAVEYVAVVGVTNSFIRTTPCTTGCLTGFTFRSQRAVLIVRQALEEVADCTPTDGTYPVERRAA